LLVLEEEVAWETEAVFFDMSFAPNVIGWVSRREPRER
jgi:hypothetical protein